MVPNPGTNEAIRLGCTCPVMDNGHGTGSGYLDADGQPTFWYTMGCPVHVEETKPLLGEAPTFDSWRILGAKN